MAGPLQLAVKSWYRNLPVIIKEAWAHHFFFFMSFSYGPTFHNNFSFITCGRAYQDPHWPQFRAHPAFLSRNIPVNPQCISCNAIKFGVNPASLIPVPNFDITMPADGPALNSTRPSQQGQCWMKSRVYLKFLAIYYQRLRTTILWIGWRSKFLTISPDC